MCVQKLQPICRSCLYILKMLTAPPDRSRLILVNLMTLNMSKQNIHAYGIVTRPVHKTLQRGRFLNERVSGLYFIVYDKAEKGALTDVLSVNKFYVQCTCKTCSSPTAQLA